MSEQQPAAGGLVREIKNVSHDVFNLMTVMYGLQENLQALAASTDDEACGRALADFNQVVAKMQAIGDRLAKLYREDGGTTAAKS